MFLESSSNIRFPEQFIYDFYFLYTALQLAKTKGVDVSEFNNNFLEASRTLKTVYIDSFSQIIFQQLEKYKNAGRVDKDFVLPTDPYVHPSILKNAMEKTFRSDMTRRNERWNALCEWLLKLHEPDSNNIEDTFFIIDRINNTIHNTGENMLSKFSNASELKSAFDICHEMQTLEDFEQYISKSLKPILEITKENIKDMKKPMAVAIDYVYDLCHNNNTVFDKLQEYSKSGHEWIENALDFRANLKNYYEILPLCSDVVKAIAPPVFYNKLGQSWQSTLQNELVNFDTKNYDKIEYSNITDIKKGDWVVLDNSNQQTPYKIAADGKAQNKMGRSNSNVLYITPEGPKRVYYKNIRKLVLKSTPTVENDPVSNPQSPNLTTPTEIPNITSLTGNSQNDGIKVGDSVICINNGVKAYENKLTIGKIYTIISIEEYESDSGLETLYEFVGDDGKKGKAFYWRFDKVPTKQENLSSSENIEVGDMVMCVNKGANTYLTVGGLYKVKEVNSYNRITIINNNGTKWDYNKGLFVKQNLPSSQKPNSSLKEEVVSHRNTKPGDIIKCVKSYFKQILLNNTYKVISIDENWVHITNESGKIGGYFPDNFVTIDNSSNPSSTSDSTNSSLKEEPATPQNIKVGDKVKCVKEYKNHLTVGKIYTVEEEDKKRCRVICDLGQIGSYSYDRFVIIPQNDKSMPTVPPPPGLPKKEFQLGDYVKFKNSDGKYEYGIVSLIGKQLIRVILNDKSKGYSHKDVRISDLELDVQI